LDFSTKNCTCCIQSEGITVWLVLDLDLSLGLGEMQGSEDAGHGNPGMLHTHGQSCTVQTQVWPAARFKCVFRPASSPIIDLACL